LIAQFMPIQSLVEYVHRQKIQEFFQLNRLHAMRIRETCFISFDQINSVSNH